MEERQLYFEVKLTDAKRDLPVEAPMPCMMIHQFDGVEQYSPVAPGCMAWTLDVEAVQRLVNVGVVGRDEHSAK